MDYFKIHQDIFYEQINVFYNESDVSIYTDFVKQRLLNNEYCKIRKESSFEKLIEFKKKIEFKQKLISDVESGKFIQNPIIFMYYWANQNRLTAFFLIEVYFKYLIDKDFLIHID